MIRKNFGYSMEVRVKRTKELVGSALVFATNLKNAKEKAKRQYPEHKFDDLVASLAPVKPADKLKI